MASRRLARSARTCALAPAPGGGTQQPQPGVASSASTSAPAIGSAMGNTVVMSGILPRVSRLKRETGCNPKGCSRFQNNRLGRLALGNPAAQADQAEGGEHEP